MAPFISRKNYAQMQARMAQAEADLRSVKGYYDGNNADNEYFKQIAAQLRGMRLPAFGKVSRDRIKEAYETIAPVNGVIDYIADNVGEVMKYLELRTTMTP